MSKHYAGHTPMTFDFSGCDEFYFQLLLLFIYGLLLYFSFPTSAFLCESVPTYFFSIILFLCAVV